MRLRLVGAADDGRSDSPRAVAVVDHFPPLTDRDDRVGSAVQMDVPNSLAAMRTSSSMSSLRTTGIHLVLERMSYGSWFRLISSLAMSSVLAA